MPRSLNSSLMKPLVVLALPGMYLAYKITEYKRQQQEQKRRKVTEKELTNLNHKIDKLLTRLEEHEPELASSQDEECVICISAKATMQTYPCGHRVVCRKCFVKTIQMTVSQRLLPLRCVICRTKILRLKQSGPGKNCPAPTPIPPGSLASLPVAALRQAASANGGGAPPTLARASLDSGVTLGAHAKCVLHKHDNQRRRSSSSDSTNQLALAAVTAAHLKAPPEHESPETCSPNDPSSSKSRPRVAPFPGKQPSMLFTIPEKEEADPYDPLSLARAIRLRAENGCAAVIESSSVAGAAVASTSVSSDFRWPRSSDPWRASPSKLQSEPGTSSSNRPSSSTSVSSSSSMSSNGASAEEPRRITRAEVHANPELWRDSPPRRAKDRGKRPETPGRKKSSEIRRVPEIVSDEASPEKTLGRGRSSPPSSSSPSPSTLSSRAYSSPTASFTGRRSRHSPDVPEYGQGLVVTAAEVHTDPGVVVSPLDHFPQMVGKNGRGFSPQILTPVKADAHHPWADNPVSSGARIKSASKSSLVETRDVDEPLSLFDPLKETSRPPTPASGSTTPSTRAKPFANLDVSNESPKSREFAFAHLEPPPRKPSKSADFNPRVCLSSESRLESEEPPIQALLPPKSTKTSTSTTSTAIQTTPVNPSPPFAPSFFKEVEGGIERNPFKDAPRAVEPVAKKSLPSAAIELLAKPSLWKENPSRSRLKMGKSGSGLLGSKKAGSRSFAPEVQPLVAKMRSAKISPAKMEARLQPALAADGWSESPTRNGGGSTRSALVDAMDPWRGSPSRTKVFPATFEITEMWGESLSKPLLSPHNSPRKQTKMSARAKMAQLSPLASLQQLRNRSPLKVLRLKHS